VGTATTAKDGLVPLDVTDRRAVRALLGAVRPRFVVNTVWGSWRVSADGAGIVAAESARVGARLVHLSTDAVHAGRSTPYTEADPPEPVTLYGAGKAAAETAVAAIDPGAVIVRTSLIIGTDESKQIRLVLDLLAGRRSGTLFTDEIRCPVHVADLAAAVLELADSRYAGVLNVAGPQAITRAELGRLVARRRGLDEAAVPVGLSADGGLGPRALDVRLDIARARAVLRTPLRPVSECV
jgi:dTDP-4-dehydrorhamnose reductase